jgi:hypothetical protein
MHGQHVDTLLFTLYEAHAQVREARDLYCDAPAETVAEAK